MELTPYRVATDAIDSDHPSIIEYSNSTVEGLHTDLEKAVALYYAARDDVLYDPYRIGKHVADNRASTTLVNGFGYCVTKAVLLAAMGRSVGLATRLGFADVKNHLTSAKLRAVMQTDIFAWHGYVEFFLDNRWVKATPAFNLSLCEKAGIKPLEFNGHDDSVFHEFDQSGQRHMEYLQDHGSFADLPLDLMMEEYTRIYPGMMSYLDRSIAIEGDFQQEVETAL